MGKCAFISKWLLVLKKQLVSVLKSLQKLIPACKKPDFGHSSNYVTANGNDAFWRCTRRVGDDWLNATASSNVAVFQIIMIVILSIINLFSLTCQLALIRNI